MIFFFFFGVNFFPACLTTPEQFFFDTIHATHMHIINSLNIYVFTYPKRKGLRLKTEINYLNTHFFTIKIYKQIGTNMETTTI